MAAEKSEQPLTQSLAKEDHADPCMACSSLEMKPEQQLKSRSSPTSEHQRLRKLPRRGSRGVKFRHGLAPGSEKVSDNDIVFRQNCTNRQEKFWSILAHKHHQRGATTRRHAGNVALRGAWSDRDTNDIFAHCSLIFYYLDFKFSNFVCPSELHPLIWFFLKNSFRKKKNIRKTSQNALAPSIFIVWAIVLKLGTPLLHIQAQNTLLQNF